MRLALLGASCLSECLIDGRAAHARLTCNARHRDALSVSGAHFGALSGCEGWWAVRDAPSSFSGCDALAAPLVDEFPLKLGKNSHDLQHHAVDG